MIVEYLKVSEIKAYENNPRNNKKAVEYVANSIRDFGFKNPIIIDKDNIIIAGHTRLLAAKKLKLKEVPCIKADEMSEEQIKAFRIADNSTATVSEWDLDLLNIELEDIEFDMKDYALDPLILADVDDFGTDFSLPEGEKGEIEQMTFTLHEEQAKMIKYAISLVKDSIRETFGNTNGNGNGLYEVVRQWAELKK